MYVCVDMNVMHISVFLDVRMCVYIDTHIYHMW